MSTTTRVDALQLSPELVEAMDHGVLTQEQLKELITAEAAELGLSFDEAVQRAFANTLPRDPLGTDIRLLVSMLGS